MKREEELQGFVSPSVVMIFIQIKELSWDQRIMTMKESPHIHVQIKIVANPKTR